MFLWSNLQNEVDVVEICLFMEKDTCLYDDLSDPGLCLFVDPTAGPEGDTHAAWYMDQRILHENIKKTLVKFCVPSPVVYR